VAFNWAIWASAWRMAARASHPAARGHGGGLRGVGGQTALLDLDRRDHGLIFQPARLAQVDACQPCLIAARRRLALCAGQSRDGAFARRLRARKLDQRIGLILSRDLLARLHGVAFLHLYRQQPSRIFYRHIAARHFQPPIGTGKTGRQIVSLPIVPPRQGTADQPCRDQQGGDQPCLARSFCHAVQSPVISGRACPGWKRKRARYSL
jgi:hypothetical protein